MTPAVIQGMYGADRPNLASTHFIDCIAHFFPSHVQDEGKFCPACAAESGYVSVFFSLAFVRWCPWHRVKLSPLCERCAAATSFRPDPFPGPEGYQCSQCGYCVPGIAVINASLRSGLCARRSASSTNFFHYVDRLQRLGILDTLGFHSDYIYCPETEAAYEAFSIDEEIKTFRIQIDMRDGGAVPLTMLKITASYRRFVAFWTNRLLKRHERCLAHARASRDEPAEYSCLFASTLVLFRQKFETLLLPVSDLRLSDSALEQLGGLCFTARALRNYFRAMFYRLFSRLWYRSRRSQHFRIALDFHYFYAPFQGRILSLDVFKGRDIRGRQHNVIVDLPTGLTVLRAILNHERPEALVRIGNNGRSISIETDAVNRYFFGVERPYSDFLF